MLFSFLLFLSSNNNSENILQYLNQFLDSSRCISNNVRNVNECLLESEYYNNSYLSYHNDVSIYYLCICSIMYNQSINSKISSPSDIKYKKQLTLMLFPTSFRYSILLRLVQKILF